MECEKVIEKARISCEATGNIVMDHFNDAIKPITGGKGAVLIQAARDGIWGC